MSTNSKRLLRDTEIIEALADNWDYESTVSPGFERSDAVLVPYPKSVLKVADFAPRNMYERFVFLFLRDKRDVAVWNVPFWTMLTLWPSFWYMFFVETERVHPLHAAAHLFVTWWQITGYHLAIHVSSHRKVFKYSVMDHWIPVLCAPFYGHTFYTYFLHHIKMHHVADNSPIDISSTIFYQRDSFIGFLHYFLRFFFLGSLDMFKYFSSQNQFDRACMAVAGEWLTLGVLGYITYNYNTMAMVWCFWVPLVASRFGMMSGNWVQHSFLDPKDPLGGGLHNSITIIESRYNLLNFNDGYHASHHLNAQRHWSEHPREFLRRRQIYVDSDAIVLKGTDYDGVFALLMTGAYEKLAELMIDMGGNIRGPHRKSVAERAKWLKDRTRKFTWGDLERIYGVEALKEKFGAQVVAAGLAGDKNKTKRE